MLVVQDVSSQHPPQPPLLPRFLDVTDSNLFGVISENKLFLLICFDQGALCGNIKVSKRKTPKHLPASQKYRTSLPVRLPLRAATGDSDSDFNTGDESLVLSYV